MTAISNGNKSMLMLCAIYTCAHLLLLFNTGLYWDDYTVFRIDPATNVDTFRQFGMTFTGYYHNFLSGLPYAQTVYRSIVFFSYLSATLCLYKILERLIWLDSSSRFFIAAIFSIFPVNIARISFICSVYAICTALFFLAFFMVARYLENRNLLLRLLSLLFFFVSFITNSLLVYFALVMVYILYKELPKYDTPTKYFRVPLNYSDLFVLPPLFWLVKMRFMQSYGPFKDYNKVSIEKLYSVPFKIGGAIKLTIVDVVQSMLQIGPVSLFLLSGAGVLLAFLICKPNDVVTKHQSLTLLALGILLLALALFPYLAVGLTPEVNSWSSRHLLLTPLGFSLALVAILQLVLPKTVLHMVLAGITVAMIQTNINNYFVMQRDWYKRASIIANMKSNDTIRNHSTFLVKDETEEFNAFAECYRFYEYTGMMRLSFGDERRFAMNVKDRVNFKNYGGLEPFLNASFALASYVPSAPEYTITIAPGSIRYDTWQTVSLMALDMFDSPRFEQEVKRLVSLQVQRI